MTELAEDREIRTLPYPRCILCGMDGGFIYREQKDRLFGAPGQWNFRRCSQRNCGLLWLDPMPVTEDIGKAYTNYYTHSSRAGRSRLKPLARVCRLIEREYLARKYNYQDRPKRHAAGLVGGLQYLFPIRRRGVDGGVRFLEAVPGGRLLDVGCGSGDWLLFMRELGWQVVGMDFDQNAVRVGQERGLEVHQGSLEEQSFADGSFDAVTLSHVIEHLPDPLGTLAECRRILKPGGKLVLLTPNGSSLGHRVFKQHWRGLEPPRHLHVFSMPSMHRLLERADFQGISIRPHIARSVIYESFLLSGNGRVGAGALARLFTWLELCLIGWNPSAADCLAAIAVKR